jgi:hypothetical protein
VPRARLGGVAAVLLALTALVSPARAREIGPGPAWCSEINGLAPGEELVLRPGTYDGPCAIRRSGRPGQPITVRGAAGAPAPRIRYDGATSNVLDVHADHVTIRGLEIGPTRPDVDAVRFHGTGGLVVEDCHFEGVGGIVVSANRRSARGITVRRNLIRNSRATAMYFGCHDGLSCAVSDLLVEGNRIETVRSRGHAVGYGIQVKLNSIAIVRDNRILDPQGPGIMVYGAADGLGTSVVERNLVAGSLRSSGIVVGGGPVLVRNNIVVANAEAGIAVEDYGRRGLLRGIIVMHNTVAGNGRSGIDTAGTLQDVSILNNAVDPRVGTSALPAPRAGLRLAGNIDCTSGGCFADARHGDFSPLPGGRLRSGPAAEDAPALSDDFWGRPRDEAPTAGAIERPAPPLLLTPAR